ncbi:MAG: hypothetical protein NT166_07810 [Candidatus Aminicenantes bacterium]|nr:hypothetical protein [Candidatus Aminicenantes bacterium]
MSHLKNETVNKCFSLLREYVEGTSQDSRKEMAILALNKLQTITAGSGVSNSLLYEDPINCNGRPTAKAS